MYRFWIVFVILGGGFAYAILRYVLCGPVSAEQLPLFLTNKALGLASLVLLSLALVAGPLGRGRLSRDHPLHPRLLGSAALVTAALHTAASAALLDPGYFGKFYRPGGRMTWQAEAALLTGLAGLAVLWWQGNVSRRAEEGAEATFPRNLGIVAVVAGAAHVAFMGYSGWLKPDSWYGRLPPLTLVGFAAAVLALAFRVVQGELRARRAQGGTPPKHSVARK